MKCLLTLMMVAGILLSSADADEKKQREKKLDELIGQLKDPDIGRRSLAAIAIGEMGPAVKKKAIPALSTLILNKAENFNVHNHAVTAISRMGPDAAPALIEAMRKSTTFVRRVSARALGDMGGAGVPALIEALQDSDRNVRLIAVQSLGRIGPQAKAARGALRKATGDRFESIATSAARSLWLIQQPKKTKPAFAHGPAVGGLAAFLHCSSTRFDVGQPISLKHGVVFHGSSAEKSIKVWRPFPPIDPENGSWLEIVGPDGNKLKYRGPYVSLALPRATERNTTVLNHGDFVGRVHSDVADAFNLTRPGEYTIRWYYGSFGAGAWQGKLVSNPVKIRIVALPILKD